MENNFQLTPELLCEFFNSLKDGMKIEYQWHEFKCSKTRREWEVVAFLEKYGTGIYKLRDDGRYRNDDFKHSTGYSLKQMLEDRDPIISVRRLSDDWTITIKDKVKSSVSGRIGIIKSFDATGHILFEDITGLDHVTTIEKLPAPVLVTADGVEAFDGMECWGIDKDCTRVLSLPITIREKDRGKWVNANLFSTRQAAETYITEHGPSLSIADLKELLVIWIPNTRLHTYVEEAVEFIKSKNK